MLQLHYSLVTTHYSLVTTIHMYSLVTTPLVYLVTTIKVLSIQSGGNHSMVVTKLFPKIHRKAHADVISN